jgi:hypothetical protein
MSVLFTQRGEKIALQNLVNQSAPQTLILRLYSNNKTPTETDVATDYTEVVGYGYTSTTLTPNNFTFVEAIPTTATYPTITYTFTGAVGYIYGYFVTQASSGNLIFANRFTNAPIQIANDGDQIRVTLTIQLQNA